LFSQVETVLMTTKIKSVIKVSKPEAAKKALMG